MFLGHYRLKVCIGLWTIKIIFFESSIILLKVKIAAIFASFHLLVMAVAGHARSFLHFTNRIAAFNYLAKGFVFKFMVMSLTAHRYFFMLESYAGSVYKKVAV